MRARTVEIHGTIIEDTFAEAFDMKYTRLIVTAVDDDWLQIAQNEFCGYGTSVIGCDAEVGYECPASMKETPDGRPGRSFLVFSFSTGQLEKAVTNRVAQCLMTCPTTAVYNGLQNCSKTIELGRHLRFFGDGFQKSKLLDDRRFWRIPVMDGEFLVEEIAGVESGVAGGNFLIHSENQAYGLEAARRAVDSIANVTGVITPFPGGVVRSGSKVGSRYSKLRASTADAYCPTLRGQVESKIHRDAHCVYEIVIDGCDFDSVSRATSIGVRSAIGEGLSSGVVAISAGNYGGKLGQHSFSLHELLSDS